MLPPKTVPLTEVLKAPLGFFLTRQEEEGPYNTIRYQLELDLKLAQRVTKEASAFDPLWVQCETATFMLDKMVERMEAIIKEYKALTPEQLRAILNG